MTRTTATRRGRQRADTEPDPDARRQHAHRRDGVANAHTVPNTVVTALVER